ncbi:hypothetical protein [Nocardia sp. NPDC050710]|uniref:hypothetical protein n=1 Tax=Nocardia sp. NPDC050710 TaxID=3157220 RepID=UPI00340E8E17
MLAKIIFLTTVPIWIWALVAIGALCGGLGIVVAVVGGGAVSTGYADLYNQCDSAVGPDPAITATSTPGMRATPEARPSFVPPTANPYAQMTIAADDTDASPWQRACAAAMPSAFYQGPALGDINGGFAVDCARALAMAEVFPSTVSTSAALTQYVIYQASRAALTGRCEVSDSTAGAAPTAWALPAGEQPAPGGCGQPPTSTTGSSPVVVVLPDIIAGQGVCGHRVEPAAVSAGDLIFWDYRDSAPTQVGLAIDSSYLVTCDAVSGRIVRQLIPADSDVRVKRVLGSGS